MAALRAGLFLGGRRDGAVEILLVKIIQQHRQQAVLVVLAQAARQRGKTRHALGLQFVAVAQARLQQRDDALRDHLLHGFIRGQRALFDGEAKARADALQLDLFEDAHQRDGRAAAARPAGAPGAVDVGLGVFRRLVLDDVRQLGQVDAARGHVGGHQKAQRALAHPPQHRLARRLRQVRGQQVGVVAKALQHGGHVFDVHLGVAEDDGRLRVFHLDDAHQAAVLVHAGHSVKDVLGLGDVDVVAAQVDEARVAHELPGQAHHLRREGGREHIGADGLLGQVALHPAHIRVKAHREHVVGFVKDQVAQVFQRQRAPQQVVEDAPGRADDDVRAGLEGIQLGAVAHAAVHGGHAHAGGAAQQLGFAGHLQGQLARGHQHQRLGGVLQRVDHLEHRQQVRAGLAAAGARLNHHVALREQIGNSLGLHGHQLVPAGQRGALAQFFGQVGQFGLGEHFQRAAGGSRVQFIHSMSSFLLSLNVGLSSQFIVTV